MEDLIAYIVKALVDKSEEVVVTEIEGQQNSMIELRVAREGIGKVIGKQGHTAQLSERFLVQPPKEQTSDSFWSLLNDLEPSFIPPVPCLWVCTRGMKAL